MLTRATMLALPFLALAGCAAKPLPKPLVVIEAPTPTGWRAIASATDQARIAALPAQWTMARSAVPRRQVAKLDAEGALVARDGALTLPAIPPGSYHCRLVRFGGRAGFAAYAPDFCYVAGDAKALSFTKQTGENLPGGWIYPDGPTRQVFLGTLRTNIDGVAPGYGHDPARDIVGVIERVGPLRWRLVMSRAGRGALLDVYELVPAPPEVPVAPTPAPVPAAKIVKSTPKPAPKPAPAPDPDAVTIIDTDSGQIPFDCGPTKPKDSTSAAAAEKRAESCSTAQPSPLAGRRS